MRNSTLNKKNIEKAILAIEQLDLETATILDIEKLLAPLFSGLIMQVPKFHVPLDIYRGRPTMGEKPSYLYQIRQPPVEKVTKMNRVNDVGESVFYGATHRNNILFELRAEEGDTVVFSKWQTTLPIILSHVGFSEKGTKVLQSSRELDKTYPFVLETVRCNDLNKYVYSYLASKFIERISSPERYKITIAIWRKLTMGNLVNGILYPSTRMYGNGDNIALKAQYADRLNFINASFMQVISKQDLKYHVKILDRATKVDKTGKLLWLGRDFQWELNNQGDEIIFEVVNGQWVARDKLGREIDPS